MPADTFNPAAGAAFPPDGGTNRNSVDETLATIRAGAGSFGSATATNATAYLHSSFTSNQFSQLGRGFITFDTNTIPVGSTISSAVLSLYYNFKSNGFAGTAPVLHVASASLTGGADIVAGDYAQAHVGTTSFGSIAYASFTAAQYNDITLNASGIAAIVVAGEPSWTQFSLQTDWDINNSFGGTWASNKNAEFIWETQDNADSAKHPKLVVTYTVPGSNRLIYGVFQAVKRASFF